MSIVHLPVLPTSIERREDLSARGFLPIAPAVFIGVQEGFGPIPATELWNLTAPILGLKPGATLSRRTIEDAGYYLPAAPKAA